MMGGNDQTKGITQLLLSPLFLLEQILGTIVPGALLLLLLAHKGSPTLWNAWVNSPFGYKTNVGVFLLLAYVVGKALTLPFLSIAAFRRDTASPKLLPALESLTPEGKTMVTGAMTEG